jgi:hypothetical protein
MDAACKMKHTPLINYMFLSVTHTLLTVSLLLESFCKLLFLTTACPQANIPRAHMKGVLFPNLVHLAFMQWSRLFQWIRAVSTSVLEQKCWVLSADCMWCRPNTVYLQMRRGDRRPGSLSLYFLFPLPLLSELTMHFGRESVRESCIDYYSW